MDNKKAIPANWVWAIHEEISAINPKLPYHNLSEESEVSFLPMACVDEVSGNYHLQNTRKYCEVKKGHTSFIDGDIIFAKITPCMENGKVAVLDNLVNGIGYGSTEFHFSRSHNFIEKKYLFYYFVQTAFRKDAQSNMTRSAGQLRVPTIFFKSVLIPIAPLPEQRAIVAKLEQLFSELDNGVACLKKGQEQLKVYRQAVLKQAFEGELTKAWREQQTSLPSAQELLETIKAERAQAARLQGKKLKPIIPLTQAELDDLPEIKEGWKWLKLGELTLGVEYGTSTKSLDNGDVPVIRMGNIQQGRIEWSNLAYTNDKTDISKYRLTKGDVLFNRTNSPELVGKTAIYNGEMPAIFAGYLIRINQITVLLDYKYLNFWLNSHPAKVYGNSVKTDGVNQSNINGEKLKSYPFPFCSPQEQSQIVQEIETRLSVCDNIESTISESLEKAEALRQSILKKAFEGKLLSEEELQITRNAPDWEPAEKLLERIRTEKRTARKKH